MSIELKSGQPLAGGLCRYGTSRLDVRGPKRELDAPYVAFMGGDDVFGRFVEKPFAAAAEDILGLPCVNLGSINAGVDSFAGDPALLDIAAGAAACVLQVLPAQNMSNRYYRVHPRRNDRFLQARPDLAGLFPEVDFTEFHFINHMLTALRDVSASRFAAVKSHLQDNWVEQMTALARAVDGRLVVLWLRREGAGGAFGPGPALVERSMVAALRGEAAGIAEFAVQAAAESSDLDGMVLQPLDIAAARLSLGPQAHMRIARMLSARLSVLLERA